MNVNVMPRNSQHEQEGTDTSTYGGDEESKSKLDNTKDESEGSSTRADLYISYQLTNFIDKPHPLKRMAQLPHQRFSKPRLVLYHWHTTNRFAATARKRWFHG